MFVVRLNKLISCCLHPTQKAHVFVVVVVAVVALVRKLPPLTIIFSCVRVSEHGYICSHVMINYIIECLPMSKQKLQQIKLNRQGRLYSRLLQKGREAGIHTEFNSTETNGRRVLNCWVERFLGHCFCQLALLKRKVILLLPSWQEILLQLEARHPQKLGTYPPTEIGK